MADYFDTMIFSSSIVIFVTALIFIFIYEFFFNVNSNNNTEKRRINEKKTKKDARIKQNYQSDRVE